jgi:hypothetical protein
MARFKSASFDGHPPEQNSLAGNGNRKFAKFPARPYNNGHFITKGGRFLCGS